MRLGNKAALKRRYATPWNSGRPIRGLKPTATVNASLRDAGRMAIEPSQAPPAGSGCCAGSAGIPAGMLFSGSAGILAGILFSGRGDRREAGA